MASCKKMATGGLAKADPSMRLKNKMSKMMNSGKPEMPIRMKKGGSVKAKKGAS